MSKNLGKVAFVEWGNYKNIWVIDSTGSNKTQLTNDDFDNAWPCFSPDGTKILYTSYTAGTPQLWTMNVDGSSKTQLTNFPEGAFQGRYSPNGQKIVYTTGSTGDDVYIMNANGTGSAALAASATDDENDPCFTADSTKVVFVKSFDNAGNPAGQIMIVNASGGTATRLTTDLQDDREPVVSQDGAWILFTRPFSVGRDVFKMALNGSGQTRVTNEAALAVSPSTGN